MSYLNLWLFKEQWRCLDQLKSFDYVLETHELLIHSPDHQDLNQESTDCPMIDPIDPFVIADTIDPVVPFDSIVHFAPVGHWPY